MIQALLYGRAELLAVFETDSGDDKIGPYQELAPPLLELPEGTVQWLAEDPTGRALIEVPAAFIRALIEGRAKEASDLLLAAMVADADRTECLDPRAHGPHEWFNARASLRRDCAGRWHHRLRAEPG